MTQARFGDDLQRWAQAQRRSPATRMRWARMRWVAAKWTYSARSVW